MAWLNQPIGWTPLRFILLIVVLWIVFFNVFRAHGAQPQAEMTDGATVACLKDENYDRYLTLLLDDVSAAIAYYTDHGCVMLPPKTHVKIDQGSTQQESNHVCTVGSYNCLWTFAGNLKKN